MRGTAWDILQVNNEATFAHHCARVFDTFAPQKSFASKHVQRSGFTEIKVHPSPYPQLLKVFVQTTSAVFSISRNVMSWPGPFHA